MKRRILVTLLSVSVSLALVACGKPASDSSVSEPEVIEEIVEATPEPIEEIVEETSEVIDETETVLEVEETSSIPADGIYKIDQVIYDEEGLQIVCDSYDSNNFYFNLTAHSSIDYRDKLNVYIRLDSVNNFLVDGSYKTPTLSGSQDFEFTMGVNEELIQKYGWGEFFEPFMCARFYIIPETEVGGTEEHIYGDFAEAIVMTDNYNEEFINEFYGEEVTEVEYANTCLHKGRVKPRVFEYVSQENGEVQIDETGKVKFYCKENEEGRLFITAQFEEKETIDNYNLKEEYPADYATIMGGIGGGISDHAICFIVCIDGEVEYYANSSVMMNAPCSTDASRLLGVDLKAFREVHHVPDEQKLNVSLKMRFSPYPGYDDGETSIDIDLGEY